MAQKKVKLNLDRRPKGSGGVRYAGTCESTGEALNIYIPQQLLGEVAESKEFPESVTLTLSKE